MAISCDLLVENREIFISHLYLAPPQGVTPSEFCKMIDAGKTRVIGKKTCDDMLSRFHLIPERNGQTDGRTDSQICYINIARQYADAR